ncbi:MAG: putative transcriptional regulator [Thermoplasmata archaeon]|jgi:predicted transcriptional regulator|nr:putative transcriptional regulator [Thermoplasmata archaeon]
MLKLRDKAGVTRVLILAELEREPGITLSEVAQRLDVTVQAVSAYAKDLVAEGAIDAEHALTPAGRASLHEGVRQLRAALDALATPLAVIRVTSAVAATRIKAGERVGLVMQEGDLAAKARLRAPSTGRALRDAEPGEEVVVGDLAGLVELAPGRLHVVAVPGPAEGGVARVDQPRLRAALKDMPRPEKVGAVGTGARILAKRLGDVHFEFAAESAAFNAAERGLPARLFVSRDRLADVMQALQEKNEGTLKRVPIDMMDAPELPA